MNKKEYIRPFLSKAVKVCYNCGKIDINTYAKYKLKDDKYVICGAYSKCQNCGKTKEFTKSELKQEL